MTQGPESAAPEGDSVPGPGAPSGPAADQERVAAMARRLEQGVETLIAALRWAVRRAGGDLTEREVEERVARLLAYLRRRLSGDVEIDAYGFDEDFAQHVYLPVLRVLYKHWFRVQVRGIANVPADGPALIVANHSGTLPLDCLMVQVAVHDSCPEQRFVRLLGADLLFRLPFVGDTVRAGGTTLAAPSDAQRLLAAGEIVAVWPEGFKGLGKPFSERYRLQRFGRGGFVATALRTQAPIVPCSIVGSEEIYPMVADVKLLARVLGLPYFPITPLFPLAGPVGLVPLPSKWHIAFGTPIETASYDVSAADDPMVTFDLTDQVRETIQQTLYQLLTQRRNTFLG